MSVKVPGHIEKELIFAQRLWEPSLLSAVMETCTSCSFQAAARLSNAFLRRDGGSSLSRRTLQDTVCREGGKMEAAINEMKDRELAAAGIDPDTGALLPGASLPGSVTSPSITETERREMAEKLADAVTRYNAATSSQEEKINWTDVIGSIDRMPENTVVMCIDDVGVHEQKASRKCCPDEAPQDKSTYTEAKKDARRGKKILETTVVYLRAREGCYRISGGSVLEAVLVALAFMLRWNLLSDRDLLIFSDGAKNIKTVVEKVFAFRPYKLYLDWYHLEKHCYELLTMALYGGKENKERNECIRHHFNKRLFAGNTDGALRYLDELDGTVVRNRGKIEEIKDYIKRKREHIYVYAARKGLGMINSSNQGEKSNDMVVAQRCKHNGMSWTYPGIRGMRNIKLAIINQEDGWYKTHKMEFRLIPLSSRVAEQYNKAA